MSVLRRKLRTARHMRRADRALALEAAIALTVARLRSGLFPFKRFARQLGGLKPPHSRTTVPALRPEEAEAVRKVRWAIAAVAPWMPFKALCLQQAVAARAMLARRGIASILHLGVGDPTGSKLEAHAWLDAGELTVTGYPVDPALTEVGRFL